MSDAVSRTVLGVRVRAYPPRAGGPVVVALSTLADMVGAPRVAMLRAVAALPRRLRQAVRRGPGTLGPAVPLRFAADLGGYAPEEIPDGFAALWGAARHWTLTGEPPAEHDETDTSRTGRGAPPGTT